MSIRYVIAVVVVLCLVPGVGTSQIPNAGFENWTGNTPDGWVTSNAPPLYTNVTQSTVAHSGASAVRGDAVLFYTTVIQPVIQVGPGGRGFGYNQRPGYFTGYYQFSPVGGDRFGINVGLFMGGVSGTAVAFAAAALPTTVTSYTPFTVPFVYQDPGVPDTCIVQIQIIGPVGGSVHAGSYYLVDDIALGGTAGVERDPGTAPLKASLEQNYPNPFNPKTNVRFGIADGGCVSLRVYDVLGREVSTLVNEEKAPGRYEVTFDAGSLASGMYYYRLQSGSYVETKTMVVVK